MDRYLRILLAWTLIASTSIPAVAENSAAGKTLYFEGKRISGKPLNASVVGGASLQGEQAACVRCHRPSGYGVNEGEVQTADITAATLFNPLEPRRDRLMRSLYQERYSSVAQIKSRIPRRRPAYQDASDILRAVREGVDTQGEPLSPMMPRYEIDDEDAAALQGFLQTLGTDATPGVDQETIHFATIIGLDVDNESKNTMLKVMQAFIDLHNQEVAREKSRADYSPLYKSELVHARRYWQLHIWTLSKDHKNWSASLEKQYTEHPVFAVLGGLAKGPWKPVQDFCESTRLPCLFPQTDWPETMPGSYTLYLSDGLPGEARLLANRLAEIKAQQVLQVTGSNPDTSSAATVFKTYAAKYDFQVETVSLANLLTGTGLQPASFDSAVLWFDGQDFDLLNNSDFAKYFPDQLFAAGSLLAKEDRRLPINLPENLKLSWPYARPGQEPPRLYRLRKWLAARRIPQDRETTALNSYLVMDAVRHALVHAVDRYSREYLIETIEHEIENLLNPGTFPRLSLGPGQRYAAKGAGIININSSIKRVLLNKSENSIAKKD